MDWNENDKAFGSEHTYVAEIVIMNSLAAASLTCANKHLIPKGLFKCYETQWARGIRINANLSNKDVWSNIML